jgi:hypothetical protein
MQTAREEEDARREAQVRSEEIRLLSQQTQNLDAALMFLHGENTRLERERHALVQENQVMRETIAEGEKQIRLQGARILYLQESQADKQRKLEHTESILHELRMNPEREKPRMRGGEYLIVLLVGVVTSVISRFLGF